MLNTRCAGLGSGSGELAGGFFSYVFGLKFPMSGECGHGALARGGVGASSVFKVFVQHGITFKGKKKNERVCLKPVYYRNRKLYGFM